MKKVIPEVLAFGVGLFLAWSFQWKVKDLVWSLWLGSLLTGYLTILCGVVGGLWKARDSVELGDGRVMKAGIAGAGVFGALFLLVFFSFHFCGFHAGHATFLASFFPIDGLESKEFGEAFINPFKLMGLAFTQLVPLYGWWLLPLFISEFQGFRDCFTPQQEAEKSELSKRGRSSGKNPEMGKIMFRPYGNVVKMHILIFVFAGLKAAGVDGFPVYAVVSFFYFFPWRVLGFGKKEKV